MNPVDPTTPYRAADSSGLSSPDDQRLIEAMREFREALRIGQAPDRDVFLARYPDLVEQLAPCLDGLLLLRQAVPAPSGLRMLPVSESEPVSLGDFRLLRKLGRGGMGIVYEAEQVSLQRRSGAEGPPVRQYAR